MGRKGRIRQTFKKKLHCCKEGEKSGMLHFQFTGREKRKAGYEEDGKHMITREKPKVFLLGNRDIIRTARQEA